MQPWLKKHDFLNTVNIIFLVDEPMGDSSASEEDAGNAPPRRSADWWAGQALREGVQTYCEKNGEENKWSFASGKLEILTRIFDDN